MLCQTRGVPADTVFLVDTVVRTRTVEKVELIYGPPYKFLSLSASVGTIPVFFYQENTDNRAFAVNGGLQLEYVHNSLLFDVGLSLQRYWRNYDKKYEVPIRHDEEWIELDTVSSYYQTDPVSGNVDRHYIVKDVYKEQTYYTSYDSVCSYQAEYYSVKVPLKVGVQLIYGFWNVDLKLGVVPEIFIPKHSFRYLELNEGGISPSESSPFCDYMCDVTAGATLRYLLTYRLMLLGEINYSKTVVPMKSKEAENSLSKSEIQVKLGLAFLIKDFDD